MATRAISGQVRRVIKAIRREMRRHHRARDRPSSDASGRHSDHINAVLAAAGYNFTAPAWFGQLLRILSLIRWRLPSAPSLA
jgi:hypothetical protein